MNLEKEYWTGCYSGNFDMITPESFAHPAKMAPQLCYRIIEHLEELGLLKAGATILDPMSGTGLTAICANAKGYKSVTIELEEKFIGFQKANREYAGRKLGKELDWQIIQGDSRKLSELLYERGLVTVSSPPYQDMATGQTPGKGVEITNRRIERLKAAGYSPEKILTPGRRAHGNLGELEHYGSTPGQLGNLPDKPLTVTSPPYEGIEISPYGGRKSLDEFSQVHSHKERNGTRYGNTQGQIGSSTGDTQSETYLSAMRLVYAEIAKVSDVCVVVTKNPTRNGKLRRLDEDTVALLREVGFSILCQHKAVLFEEHETQDLFGVNHKKVKGRMSFFKRLSYQKGAPVAAWEDVIFAVKNGESELVTVSSPPYQESQQGGGGITKRNRQVVRHSYADKDAPKDVSYGTTSGQIGNLKDK